MFGVHVSVSLGHSRFLFSFFLLFGSIVVVWPSQFSVKAQLIGFMNTGFDLCQKS